MREAVGALLDFALGALALLRIEADVDPRNRAFCHALERLGFAREGLIRERWIVGGEACDTAWHGLLAREWRRAQAAQGLAAGRALPNMAALAALFSTSPTQPAAESTGSTTSR